MLRIARAALLHLYYGSTLPYRCWQAEARARRGAAPIMVLYYHRVAEDRANSWTMKPEMFARQMRWLKQHFDMISLEEAQQRIRSGENHRAAVSITFDDGYADNCNEAIPLLIRERIPCTYFVSTHYVMNNAPFPHDVAQGNRFAPNTMDQLRCMSAAGIEIAAHTRNHADLGQIRNASWLRDEIVTSGEELQSALGAPVRYFAFPYGMPANMSAEAFHLALDAGYDAVCSAYGGYNFPGDDAFHLQRIHGDDLFIRLKNHLTLDPRKLRRPYRYDYRLPELARAPQGTPA